MDDKKEEIGEILYPKPNMTPHTSTTHVHAQHYRQLHSTIHQADLDSFTGKVAGLFYE